MTPLLKAPIAKNAINTSFCDLSDCTHKTLLTYSAVGENEHDFGGTENI